MPNLRPRTNAVHVPNQSLNTPTLDLGSATIQPRWDQRACRDAASEAVSEPHGLREKPHPTRSSRLGSRRGDAERCVFRERADRSHPAVEVTEQLLRQQPAVDGIAAEREERAADQTASPRVAMSAAHAFRMPASGLPSSSLRATGQHGGKNLKRVLVLLSLFAATNCRERDSLCGSGGCAEAGAGGYAGAAGADGEGGFGADGFGSGGTEAGGAGRESTSGAPGSAGAGGSETNRGNGGNAGNGAGEGGDAGGGGAAMSSECGQCAPGLHCVEQDAGDWSCEYEKPGRWLVFSGNETSGESPLELRALRLEGTKPSASILLSDGAVGESYEAESWSPDGRHLIAFGFAFDDFSTNTLLHVEFGDGLPSAAAPLPDLPVSGQFTVPTWAADSSRLLVENVRSLPELYLVRFTDEGIRTQLLFRDVEATELSFCKNPRWFVRQLLTDGQFETRLVDSENPAEERNLWPGFTSVSPDGHWLIGSDYDTGLRRTTCEGDGTVVRFNERSAAGFEWSKDSRFVIVPYDDGEIAVLDASNDFLSVVSAYHSDHSWPWNHVLSSPGSRLVVFGASEPGAECEVIDVDLSTTSPEVRRRGPCPETDLAGGGSWGVLENGSIWALSEDSDALRSLWLLEPGEAVWRPIAAGLSNTYPNFTPDEKYVVFNDEPSDGTVETLAFSLLEPEPTAMPLRPAPAAYVTTSGFYADGVILNGGDSSEPPYSGQLWWAPLGPTGFGTIVPWSDVSFASSPRLQPER
jgi:hypothetical protein